MLLPNVPFEKEILLPRREMEDSWFPRKVEEPLVMGPLVNSGRKRTFVDGTVNLWTCERPAFFFKHKSYC